MKKLIMASLAAILMVAVVNVDAMTKAELKTKITSDVKVNGETVSLKAGTKNTISKYIDSLTLEDDDITYLSEKYDAVVKIIKDNKVTSEKAASKLPESVKAEIKAIAADVTANTPANVSIVKGEVVLLTAGNEVFATLSDAVKQTGSETSLIATVAGIALVVTVIGAFMVVKQVKNN